MGALYGLLKDLVCRLMCASRSLQTRIARVPQDETFPNASELPLNSSNDNLNANLRPVYKGPASHRARSHTSPTIHVHTRVSLCFRKLQRQRAYYIVVNVCIYVPNAIVSPCPIYFDRTFPHFVLARNVRVCVFCWSPRRRPIFFIWAT